MSTPLRIIVTAFDYRPRLGGVATCADHLAAALSQRQDIDLVLLAPEMEGANEHDQGREFPIRRVFVPNETFLATPFMAKHLRQLISEFKPDAILNTLWLPDAVATRFVLSFSATKCPYFILTHAVEVLESSGTLKKRLRKNLKFIKNNIFNNAKLIFSVSDFTKDLVLKNTSIPRENIKTIFNGVNTSEFFFEPPREDLQKKFGLTNKQVLLTISRLVPNKGIDQTLAALAQMGPANRDIVYLICGTGPDLDRLKKLTADYTLEDQVKFVGVVPPEELRDYYNLCDLFVLLSREDLITPAVEGFGIVFLEAGACAKPTMGGRSGGVASAIADGVSGWLVDPENTSEISRTLHEALAFQGELKRRGEQGLSRIKATFTWDHVAERVVNEIKAGLK